MSHFTSRSSAEHPITEKAPHLTGLELLAQQALNHAQRGNAAEYAENRGSREAIWRSLPRPDGSRSALHIVEGHDEMLIDARVQHPRILVDQLPLQTTISSTLTLDKGELSIHQTGLAPETHELDELRVAQVMHVMHEVLAQAGVVLEPTAATFTSH